MNFDGITDLADWAILNREHPSLAAAAIARLSIVPEPSTWMQVALAFAKVFAALRLRPVRLAARRI